MFSFARRALLWPAAAAVKAQDKLAALGLDSRLASHTLPGIRAKENIRYELTQPQSRLTSTGLLMEGQTAFRELQRLEARIGENAHIQSSEESEELLAIVIMQLLVISCSSAIKDRPENPTLFRGKEPPSHV
jgi:hypothetical protein